MNRFPPLAAALCAALATSAAAEPLPRPTVDFAAQGTLTGGKGAAPATMRHKAGKVRVDTEADGQATSIFIDHAARSATVVSIRFGQKVALEIDPDRAAGAQTPWDLDATRVGSATVAGENCVEYEVENARGRKQRVCLARDGVPLRTIDVSRDRVAWIATQVTRAPQEASLFAVPGDAMRVQLPPKR